MDIDTFLQSVGNNAFYRLYSYATSDTIYNEYMKNKSMKCSDFDMFCINHCQDILTMCECVKKIDKLCKDNPENYKEIAEIIKKVFD